MHSFENAEINTLKEGRTIFQRVNILKKDPYNRCIGILIEFFNYYSNFMIIGYLVFENVLVLLPSKEIFPFLGLDPLNSAHAVNISMNE